MKKFIPLLIMAVGVFSLASCRQSDDMESSVNTSTKKSINTQPIANATSTNDSISIQTFSDESDDTRDGTRW